MTTSQTLNGKQPTVTMWQTAFDECLNKMPVTNVVSKQDLPIFAVIITANINVSDDVNDDLQQPLTQNIDNWITAWANQQAQWDLLNVNSSDAAQAASACFVSDDKNNVIENDRLTPIDTCKYLLYPSSVDAINHLSYPEKITAAAHVIDEQITAMLHDKLGNQFDCHILLASKLTKPHKLAFFDMDSTLIEQEVIVELAKATNIGDKVNEITESAMRGEIDFNESFVQRVALLKGTSTEVLDEINSSLTLSAGAKTTLATLKAMGFYTVLVSGGFTYFAKHIAKKLNMDEFHANELDTLDGMVTGDVVLPIVNGEMKAAIVQKIAQQKGIALSEVICIGDGANDLAMMAVADIGLAYRAKPIVQAKADLAINCTGLEGVLYALGVNALSQKK